LLRGWVASQLKTIYDRALMKIPVAIDRNGQEVFLKAPDHRTAMRALQQLTQLLRLDEQPIEEPEDDLARMIAELKAARQPQRPASRGRGEHPHPRRAQGGPAAEADES
jgi:hypothetical protein